MHIISEFVNYKRSKRKECTKINLVIEYILLGFKMISRMAVAMFTFVEKAVSRKKVCPTLLDIISAN